MRVNIKVKDFKGKKTEIQKEIPAKDHLEAQIKYRSAVFRDKTKYTRKKKHKNRTEE